MEKPKTLAGTLTPNFRLLDRLKPGPDHNPLGGCIDITVLPEKTETPKERVDAIAEKALQLNGDINRLISDFKAETGCEVHGKIDNGVADVFTTVNIEKVL